MAQKRLCDNHLKEHRQVRRSPPSVIQPEAKGPLFTLPLPLSRCGNRSNEFGRSLAQQNLMNGLTGWVKLPMTSRLLVRAVQYGLFKNGLTASSPPLALQAEKLPMNVRNWIVTLLAHATGRRVESLVDELEAVGAIQQDRGTALSDLRKLTLFPTVCLHLLFACGSIMICRTGAKSKSERARSNLY
jgi:hypothetical protein